MNYSSHNLRTTLQELKSRLCKAEPNQFGFQLKFVLERLNSNKQIEGITKEAINLYSYGTDQLDSYCKGIQDGRRDMEFSNQVEQASFCLQFLEFYIKRHNTYDLHLTLFRRSRGFRETLESIIEEYITPIFYYLHDKLDESNSVIYLLEKYKRRIEWFTKDILVKKYAHVDNRNYEKIFEDDLRLFLFDQGIDYPFSTPASASGRADIVGNIDTNDPLVLEIKIVDKEKGYGKNRIISGFTQIVKYANDYNKNIGYLVVFNLDKTEIKFDFKDLSRDFPTKLHFNHQTFFFIVINLYSQTSASKSGTTDLLVITEDELTSLKFP